MYDADGTGVEGVSESLLTAEQVAELLGVRPRWVYEHSTGKVQPEVPNFKLGKYRRYRRDEIERWLVKRGVARTAA